MNMVFQKGHSGYRAKQDDRPVPPPVVDLLDAVDAWRFGYNDLGDMGIWLLGKLATKLPHLNDRNYVGWLRGCMESSEFFFVRTKNAVGLFQRVQGQIDQFPRVREIFLWSRDQDSKLREQECGTICDDMMRWAKALSASEVILSGDGDLSNDFFRVRFSRLYTRNEMYMKL